MERAGKVFTGVMLILTVWTWMIVSIVTPISGWLAILVIVCRIGVASLVTGPIYREYLR